MQSSEIDSESATAYWIDAPAAGRIGPSGIGAGIPIKALYSAVSPGTERLVGLGLIPKSDHASMACLGMEGSFDFPLKYGYSMVGRVLAGENTGRVAYTMHPHQDYFRASESSLLFLPESLDPVRATLIANTETALNALWDGEVLPGERILIIGGGIVGCLIAAIVSQVPGAEVMLLETNSEKIKHLRKIPWRVQIEGTAPDAAAFDLCFHASGSHQGLQTAINAVGFEGRVLELSWYGEKSTTLNLGGDFHYQRKRIISTQVGSIATVARSRFDYKRRLAVVLKILENPIFDEFISHKISFSELPQFMKALYNGNLNPLSVAVCYGKE
jgi:threonine dehydrogenase-like Zn-dependent dehydrogenase